MTDRRTLAVAELVAALRAEIATGARPVARDRLLSVADAAATLGLGRSALYREVSAGRLQTIKVGRRRLVPSSANRRLHRDRLGGNSGGMTSDTGRHDGPGVSKVRA